MKLVLDTNILISALGWDGNERRIFQKILSDDQIMLIVSEELLFELSDVLGRPKFNFISIEKKSEFLKSLIALSEIIEPIYKIDVVDDHTDNKNIECALTGKADYIVTGDEHLLKLKLFKGIKIITAREYLEIIDQ